MHECEANRRREEGRMGKGQDRERGKEAGRWVGVTVGIVGWEAAQYMPQG